MGRIIFKLETIEGDIIVLVAKNEAEARRNASEYSNRFRVNYRDLNFSSLKCRDSCFTERC